jgi:hypothetical protein
MTLSMKAEEYLHMLTGAPDCALAVSMGSALPMTSASLRLLPPRLRGRGKNGVRTAKQRSAGLKPRQKG